MIKLTECPRDAMQGIGRFIPTALKIKYINSLLKVGFDVIDFGSFVSPKIIPQLKDTVKVLSGLDLSSTNSKLLAIIANERGANEASMHDEISILGFPFSVSEVFQLRNTKSTREQSLETVKKIKEICDSSKKKLRVYLSMGFGNPYGEEYSVDIVLEWAWRLSQIGIEELVLSDTIGVSKSSNIKPLFELLLKELNTIEISAHFHSAPNNWKEKVVTAYNAGCISFDTAVKGIGGCPLADNELVGNLATENIIDFFADHLSSNFDKNAFQKAVNISGEVFK